MNHFKTITIAGGCFWGVEAYFDKLAGIEETTVGYANGRDDHEVSYREVCTGLTGHAEAVMLTYNPDCITLIQIIEHLIRIIDPTSLNKQGNDIGTQYRTGIYPTLTEDLETANAFIKDLENETDKKIVVEVEYLSNYILAEPEHQAYLEYNPGGYCHVDFSLIQDDELKN